MLAVFYVLVGKTVLNGQVTFACSISYIQSIQVCFGEGMIG